MMKRRGVYDVERQPLLQQEVVMKAVEYQLLYQSNAALEVA